MSNWNELKHPFRNALINAFNVDTFEAMLRFPPCERELEQLTGRNQSREKIVDDVIANAERNGWLQKLAEGALAANPTHTGLKETASAILAGIKAQGGNAFYQAASPHNLPPASHDAHLRPYLEWVAQQSERLALSLLDPSGGKTARLELAKVFINLHTTPREWHPPQEREIKFREQAALAAAHAERQLILLGDPGSGKSTLLRFLVFCLAQAVLEPTTGWLQQLKWQREQIRKSGRFEEEVAAREEHHWHIDTPLPVLIELRDFARHPFHPSSPLALWNYVEQQLSGRGLEAAVEPLAAQARSGNVIFLLDGVDEVPAGQRQDVWQAITALADGVYAHCRWIATCRILSFDANEAPDGIPEYTLQQLTSSQIENFIGCWYSVLAEMGELSDERAAELTTHLQQQTQRSALQELAQNPMLLTIMAIVQTYYGTLPEERARLYQACVETLLLRWQLPKEITTAAGQALPDMLVSLGVNQQKLERLLWEIAWQAHREDVTRAERADIKESEIMALAAKHLGGYDKAEQFLSYTEQRAHLLVGRGGIGERVYSFPHRTFQEYLAACYLTPGLRLLKEAPRLAAEGDTWREVLNLAAGALVYNNNNFEQVLYAVERMVSHQPPAAADTATWHCIWLAGEMSAVVGRQNFEESDLAADLLPLLRERLVNVLEQEALTPQQRAESGDTLGVLGDPRPGVCTLEPDLIEIAAGDFLFGDEKETHTIAQPFAIARYPVTVAQFGMFVADGGYEEVRYWGNDEESKGWQWRLREHPDYRGEGPVTHPRHWQQSRWHGPNRPVIGVSWYEAQAYCVWLSEKSEREYRLPTEEEWERAARHTDGRNWAWGNEWEDGIINTDEAQIGRTTSVGAFPRGVTECGAEDMSGNVWEWTASLYDDNRNIYSVRGGSWANGRDYARVAYRLRDGPYYSGSFIGFRLVSPVF